MSGRGLGRNGFMSELSRRIKSMLICENWIIAVILDSPKTDWDKERG
jgi:hypothetical protein